jgi:tetratricopeptide (TPR) repeat protein
VIVLFAFIAAAAGQLQTNYAHADKSAKFLAYDAGMSVLDTMEQNAVLFIQKDWISFSLAYLTAVEKRRPDVTIYNRTSTMFPNLPGLFDRKFRSIYEVMQRANEMEDDFIKSTDRPVYFDDRKSVAKLPGYRIHNKGFLYKITKERDDQVISPFESYYIRNLNDPPEAKNMAECKIFIDYYVHLAEDRFEAGKKDEALEALKKAEFYARETFSEKQNIMLVYVENGYYKEALELLEQQARLLPGYAVTYKKMGLLYAQYFKDGKKAVYYLNLYLEKDPFAYDRQAILELIKKISASSRK